QYLRPVFGDFGELTFEGLSNTGVQLTPRFAQQSAASRVLYKCVLEQISRVRGHTLPKQQASLNDPVERRAEFWLRLTDYRSYQRMRELSPNHRSDLRHLLGRPEAIQPRHQGGVQSRRDRKSRGRNGRSRTLSSASAFRFQYHLRHLFHEQRNAI